MYEPWLCYPTRDTVAPEKVWGGGMGADPIFILEQ